MGKEKLAALFSVIAWAGVAVVTVINTTVILILYLLRRWIDPELSKAHRAAAAWGRSLLKLAPGCKVELVGVENIPKDRPVIFMANHQSYVDVPALFYLPGQFKWMADEPLFHIPVFGWAMRWAGYVPVRRGDAKTALKSMERAKEWLAKGVSIFIFPEGTRSRTGVLAKFHAGGFRLSLASGTPVVPVAISGTRQLLPRGSWIFRLGAKVRIEILPPIPAPAQIGQVHPLAHRVRQEIEKAYRREIHLLHPTHKGVLH